MAVATCCGICLGDASSIAARTALVSFSYSSARGGGSTSAVSIGRAPGHPGIADTFDVPHFVQA